MREKAINKMTVHLSTVNWWGENDVDEAVARIRNRIHWLTAVNKPHQPLTLFLYDHLLASVLRLYVYSAKYVNDIIALFQGITSR